MHNLKKVLLIVLVLLGMLTYLYWHSSRLDVRLHDQALTEIVKFDKYSTEIDRDILRIRSGLLGYYDPINAKFKRAYTTLKNLKEILKNQKSINHNEILKQHSILEDILKEKKNLAEVFKSEAALLRNSLSYMIHLGKEIGLGGIDFKGKKSIYFQTFMQQLTLNLLESIHSPSTKANKVLHKILSINTDFIKAPQFYKNEVNQLWKHGKVVIYYLPRVDKIIKDILSLPLEQESKKLKNSYFISYGQADKLARLFDKLSYLIAIILVFYVSYLFICLRNNADNLRKTNKALKTARNKLHDYATVLESRVSDRTAALEAANKAITVLNKKLKADNTRMEAELDVTRRLQQMVLPQKSELQNIKHVDVAAMMYSAEEVAGDYYDVIEHDDSIYCAMGDVTGHGLESGVLMLMVQTAMKTLIESGISTLPQCLSTLNRVIYANVQRMQSDKNLTFLLLQYHADTLRICGQHEELLLVRKNGDVERIDTLELGFMIGLEPDISDFLQQSQHRLNIGDGVVLYTDGITEAQNNNNEMYGVERLCEQISATWNTSSEQICQHIHQDVNNYVAGLAIVDDLSLLVFKRLK